MENLVVPMDDAPKLTGIPSVHVLDDAALPGEPEVNLIPGFFSKTHESQTVCPELTATGLASETVCHPAEELTGVDADSPNLEAGYPLWSEYTPRITFPAPPSWYMAMLVIWPFSLKVTGIASWLAHVVV